MGRGPISWTCETLKLPFASWRRVRLPLHYGREDAYSGKFSSHQPDFGHNPHEARKCLVTLGRRPLDRH